MPKVSIDETMDQIVSINNQITGLQMLLNHKKATMAKFFEKSGERSVSNDQCSVFLQERTTIEYDIHAMKEKVEPGIYSQIVEKHYSIKDWPAFVSMCKQHGINPAELRPFVSVESKVNQEKLSKLYEKGVVSLSDLDGCYTATVKKSVALRMKNVDNEIPISE